MSFRFCFLCQREVPPEEFLESLGRCYGCLPLTEREVKEILLLRDSEKRKKKPVQQQFKMSQAKTLSERAAKGVNNADH